jgi:hypothetical protein
MIRPKKFPKRESAYADWGPCRGSFYVPGSKRLSENPTRYEEFEADCLTCHQRIGMVVGTDRLKMHESKLTWARKPIPPRRPMHT